jgi:hypothetical protein
VIPDVKSRDEIGKAGFTNLHEYFLVRNIMLLRVMLVRRSIRGHCRALLGALTLLNLNAQREISFALWQPTV